MPNTAKHGHRFPHAPSKNRGRTWKGVKEPLKIELKRPCSVANYFSPEALVHCTPLLRYFCHSAVDDLQYRSLAKPLLLVAFALFIPSGVSTLLASNFLLLADSVPILVAASPLSRLHLRCVPRLLMWRCSDLARMRDKLDRQQYKKGPQSTIAPRKVASRRDRGRSSLHALLHLLPKVIEKGSGLCIVNAVRHHAPRESL